MNRRSFTGAELRLARKAAGLNQSQLARRLHVNPSTVHTWEIVGGPVRAELQTRILVALPALRHRLRPKFREAVDALFAIEEHLGQVGDRERARVCRLRVALEHILAHRLAAEG